MFSPFTANSAATDTLRLACRRAAEHQARAQRNAGASTSAPAAGRRAAAGFVMGGWLLGLLALAGGGKTPNA